MEGQKVSLLNSIALQEKSSYCHCPVVFFPLHQLVLSQTRFLSSWGFCPQQTFGDAGGHFRLSQLGKREVLLASDGQRPGSQASHSGRNNPQAEMGPSCRLLLGETLLSQLPVQPHSMATLVIPPELLPFALPRQAISLPYGRHKGFHKNLITFVSECIPGVALGAFYLLSSNSCTFNRPCKCFTIMTRPCWLRW